MPTGQEFQEALQNPRLCLSDDELRAGRPRLDGLGLPKPVTGNFAAVFTLECDDRVCAVKCFYSAVQDRLTRYAAIHSFLERAHYPWEVSFDYVPKGVLVRGTWHPVVKMEWVEADRLDRYVEDHLGDPQEIARLAKQFAVCVESLRTSGAAHGDLQHGNILVTKDGELRLIDYDGMFVPGLKGRRSNEVGHPNYQHPRRAQKHFGPSLDNFSAWVIYVSLLALARDPTIWSRVGGGDERLVFERRDFLGDAGAPGLRALEGSGDDVLRELGSTLRSLARLDVANVPPLKPDGLGGGRSWTRRRPERAAPPGVAPAALPSWLARGAALSSRRAAGPQKEAGVAWMAGRLQPAVEDGLPAVSRSSRLDLVLSLAVLVLAVGLLTLGVLAWPVAVTVGVACAGWYFVSEWFLYRRVGVVVLKRRAARRRRTAQTAAARADRHVALLLRERETARERDEAARVRLLEEESAVRQRAQDGIEKAGTARDKAVAAIRKKRQLVADSMQREAVIAATRWGDEFVRRALSSRTIAAAGVAGIGAETCACLARAGIRTAADVSYGRALAVDGVGPAKAETLDRWRRGIERRARAAAITLPAAEADRISERTAVQLRRLDERERRVQEAADEDARLAQRRATDEQRALAARIRAHDAEAQRRAVEAERGLLEAVRIEAEDEGRLAQAVRDEAVYAAVTFTAFLAGTVSLRSRL